jgi:hypothetical protein
MPGNDPRFQLLNNPACDNFVNFHFFFLLLLNGFPSKNILKNQLHEKAVQRARKSRRRFYAMPGGYCKNIVRAF